MRLLFAIAASSLVLLTAVAPHVHTGAEGRNGCQACVMRAAEEAAPATPDVAPAVVGADTLVAEPAPGPVAGFPVGAVPGQSPPRA